MKLIGIFMMFTAAAFAGPGITIDICIEIERPPEPKSETETYLDTLG